jgi:WD40 repeat protein
MADAAARNAIDQTLVAEQHLWESKFEQARAERLSGNRWRALELIGETARSKVTPELEREAAQAVTAFGLRLVSKTPGRGLSFGGGDGPFIVFSHDGSLFAAPNSYTLPDGRSFSGVTVHETLTGKIVAEVSGNYYGGDFTFHPSRPVLAISRGGRIVLHDMPAGTETDLGPGTGHIYFDPAGNSLVASGDRITVYDLAGGPPRVLGVGGQALGFIPTGLMVRSYEKGRSRFRVWDVAADRPHWSAPPDCTFLSASPNGRRAVLQDEDHRYTVWDLADGRPVQTLPELNKPPYRATVPFSPTEPLVAYENVAASRTIELADLANGGRVRERLLISGRGPRALLYGRFRPDGSILSVEDDYQGDVTLWEVGTGKLLATLPDHNKASWSPDGRYLATFCATGWAELPGGGRTKNETSHIRVYEVANVPGRGRLDRPVNRLSFSPDGSELAAADTVWRLQRPLGGPARLRWESRDQRRRTGFFDPRGGLWHFPLGETLKPDTRFMLTRVGVDPMAVSFPGRPHIGFDHMPDAGRVTEIAVAPDGRRAVLVWDGYRVPKPGQSGRTGYARLECWDLDGPRLVGLWAEEGAANDLLSVAYSPDGRRVAAVGNGGLKVWDTRTGKKLTGDQNLGGKLPRCLAFTPDSRHVVVGFDGGQVTVATLTAEVVTEVAAHDGDVAAVAVSPDGRFVVSAADDRTVAVWDRSTMTRLARWVAADAAITAVAFAPDSRTLAVGDAKGFVQVWDVSTILGELARLGLHTGE